MKKLLFLSLLFISKVTFAQNNLFIENKWSYSNIMELKDHVGSIIGGDYKLTGLYARIAARNNEATFAFSTNSKELSATLERGYINGNSDLGIAADTIISFVQLTGFYGDIFKIYNLEFAPGADKAAISQKGFATPIIKMINKTKVSIAFYRGSDQTGNWDLLIRPI